MQKGYRINSKLANFQSNPTPAGALGLGALGTGAYALTRPKQPDQIMY